MDTFIIVLISLLLAAQSLVIYMLLRQLDRLQNKLMARDFTEYAVHNREKPPGKAENFLKASINRAYTKGNVDDEP